MTGPHWFCLAILLFVVGYCRADKSEMEMKAVSWLSMLFNYLLILVSILCLSQGLTKLGGK